MQRLGIEVHSWQPENNHASGVAGENALGMISRLTFLPRHPERALLRVGIAGRDRFRQGPGRRHESDMLAIQRDESALGQSFEHRLPCAQARLALFAVRPGVQHYREHENMLRESLDTI